MLALWMCVSAVYVFGYSLCVLPCLSQPTRDISSVDLVRKKCANDIVYRNLFDVTVDKCVTECKRRSRCHHILYKEEMKYCGFIEDTTLNVDQDDNVAQCSYVNVDAIDFSVSGPSLGECINTPCGITQRCSTNDTSYQCEESECLAAPPLLNGTLLSDVVAVGDKTTYHCDWPLVLDGPGGLYITCMSDGQWSDAGLTCAKTCPSPLPALANAVLSYSSDPRMKIGTSLRYDCVDGYQGLSASDTFECEPSGSWDHKHLKCCRDGYVWFFKTCVKMKDGITTSSVDMKADCNNDGTEMYPFNKYLAEFIISDQSGSVQAIVFENKKSDFQYNKLNEENQDCVRNEFEPGTNMGEVPVEELVTRGRLATPECDFAKRWYTGEPNGYDNEKCLMAGTETDFLLADAPCDSFEDTVGYVCFEKYKIY